MDAYMEVSSGTDSIDNSTTSLDSKDTGFISDGSTMDSRVKDTYAVDPRFREPGSLRIHIIKTESKDTTSSDSDGGYAEHRANGPKAGYSVDPRFKDPGSLRRHMGRAMMELSSQETVMYNSVLISRDGRPVMSSDFDDDSSSPEPNHSSYSSRSTSRTPEPNYSSRETSTTPEPNNNVYSSRSTSTTPELNNNNKTAKLLKNEKFLQPLTLDITTTMPNYDLESSRFYNDFNAQSARRFTKLIRSSSLNSPLDLQARSRKSKEEILEEKSRSNMNDLDNKPVRREIKVRRSLSLKSPIDLESSAQTSRRELSEERSRSNMNDIENKPVRREIKVRRSLSLKSPIDLESTAQTSRRELSEERPRSNMYDLETRPSRRETKMRRSQSLKSPVELETRARILKAELSDETPRSFGHDLDLEVKPSKRETRVRRSLSLRSPPELETRARILKTELSEEKSRSFDHDLDPTIKPGRREVKVRRSMSLKSPADIEARARSLRSELSRSSSNVSTLERKPRRRLTSGLSRSVSMAGDLDKKRRVSGGLSRSNSMKSLAASSTGDPLSPPMSPTGVVSMWFNHIQEDVQEESDKSSILTRQKNFNDNCCIRCYSTFFFLFNKRIQCNDCKFYVCKGCTIFSKTDKAYVCKICLRQRELTSQSCEWFYGNIKQKFKRFGSAKVVRSLYKRKSELLRRKALSDSENDSGYDPSLYNSLPAGKRNRATVQDVLESPEFARKSALQSSDPSALSVDVTAGEDRLHPYGTDEVKTFANVKSAELDKFQQQMDSLATELRRTIDNQTPQGLPQSQEEYEKLLDTYKFNISGSLSNLTQTLHLAVDNQSTEGLQSPAARHTQVKEIVTQHVEQFIGKHVDLGRDEVTSDFASEDESTGTGTDHSYEEILAQAILDKIIQNQKDIDERLCSPTSDLGRNGEVSSPGSSIRGGESIVGIASSATHERLKDSPDGTVHSSDLENREQLKDGATEQYGDQIHHGKLKNAVDGTQDEKLQQGHENTADISMDSEWDEDKLHSELAAITKLAESEVVKEKEEEKLNGGSGGSSPVAEEDWLAEQEALQEKGEADISNIYSAIDLMNKHEVPLPSFDTSQSESELDKSCDLDDITFSSRRDSTSTEENDSLAIDRTPSANWFFCNKGIISPYDNFGDKKVGRDRHVLMLVPPFENSPKVGDRDVDELSDLSENATTLTDFCSSNDEDSDFETDFPGGEISEELKLVTEEIKREFSTEEKSHDTSSISVQTDDLDLGRNDLEPKEAMVQHEVITAELDTVADPSEKIAKEAKAEILSKELAEDAIDAAEVSLMESSFSSRGGDTSRMVVELGTAEEETDPKFTERPQNVMVPAGEPAKVTCKVEGTEPVDVFWYRDTEEIQQLEEGDNFDIYAMGNSHVLEVYNTCEADVGQYFCIGINENGRCHQSFGLKVEANSLEQNPPDFVKGLDDVEVVEGQSVKFRVKVRGYPTPRVLWFKEGKRIKNCAEYRIEKIGARGYSLSLDYPTIDDDAEYTVVAKNTAGQSQSSALLSVEPTPVTEEIKKIATPAREKEKSTIHLSNISQKISSTRSEMNNVTEDMLTSANQLTDIHKQLDAMDRKLFTIEDDVHKSLSIEYDDSLNNNDLDSLIGDDYREEIIRQYEDMERAVSAMRQVTSAAINVLTETEDVIDSEKNIIDSEKNITSDVSSPTKKLRSLRETLTGQSYDDDAEIEEIMTTRPKSVPTEKRKSEVLSPVLGMLAPSPVPSIDPEMPELSYPDFERLYKAGRITRDQLSRGQLPLDVIEEIQLGKLSYDDADSSSAVEKSHDLDIVDAKPGVMDCGLKRVDSKRYRRDFIVNRTPQVQRKKYDVQTKSEPAEEIIRPEGTGTSHTYTFDEEVGESEGKVSDVEKRVDELHEQAVQKTIQSEEFSAPPTSAASTEWEDNVRVDLAAVKSRFETIQEENSPPTRTWVRTTLSNRSTSQSDSEKEVNSNILPESIDQSESLKEERVSNLNQWYDRSPVAAELTSSSQSEDRELSYAEELGMYEAKRDVVMLKGEIDAEDVPDSRTEADLSLPSVRNLRSKFNSPEIENTSGFKRVYSLTARDLPRSQRERLRKQGSQSERLTAPVRVSSPEYDITEDSLLRKSEHELVASAEEFYQQPIRSPVSSDSEYSSTSTPMSAAAHRSRREEVSPISSTSSSPRSTPRRAKQSSILARAAFWDMRVEEELASDKHVPLEFPKMPEESFKSNEEF